MAKAYVREQWTPVLWSIRSVWYQAAQRTGAVESAARLLLDMMSPGRSEGGSVYVLSAHVLIAGGGPPPEDPTQYQEDLQALMTVRASISIPSDTSDCRCRLPRLHLKLVSILT
jgi:hypothetical protein